MPGMVTEEIIQQYLAWDPNEETKNAIQEYANQNDQKNLEHLLSKRLAFGTAGLRAVMGPGYNAINDLVVLQTIQGLIRYLDTTFGAEAKTMGVVIGYDHRQVGSLSSISFARMTAAVLLHENYKVYGLEGFVPTPFVPFSVTHFRAAAGIMITASHNPKDDNGYKVYWSNGSQIIPPHDNLIATSIENNLAPWIPRYNTDECDILSHPLFHDVTSTISSAYIQSLRKLLSGVVAQNPVRIAYTAMHGIGGKWIARAFTEISSLNRIPEPLPVLIQIEPDPLFPTVKFPNPEEKGALDEAIKFATTNRCTIILANDPDADRLAVAEFMPDAPAAEDGNYLAQWKVFSGNEIGVILGHYQITKYLSSSPTIDRSRGALVSTVVSSRMLQTIAEKEGLYYADTLTGFKWIGNESLRLQQDGYHVLFSYEEALGYCVGDIICDKDGISAAITISELINTLSQQNNKTLLQYYKDIQQQYGLFVSYNTYVFSHDKQVTKQIFARLRNFNNDASSTGIPIEASSPPMEGDDTSAAGAGAGYWKQTGAVAVRRIRDITLGYDSAGENGKSTLPITPDSEMLMFEFENNCTLIIRTSGTEPKIKCYSEMVSTDPELTEEMIRSQLQQFIELCIEEMIQPQVHQLTRP